MGRSRYVITNPAQPHFLTCTVMEWLPLFSRPALVDILLDCWRYQQTHQGLRLYGYVVMENHLHYLAQAPYLARCVSSFKSYTARRILDDLQRRGAESVLQRLSFLIVPTLQRGNAALDAPRPPEALRTRQSRSDAERLQPGSHVERGSHQATPTTASPRLAKQAVRWHACAAASPRID